MILNPKNSGEKLLSYEEFINLLKNGIVLKGIGKVNVGLLIVNSGSSPC